jgi:hypothetical protein
MYTSRSQSAASQLNNYHNPTLLGDEALRLIKIILVNRGSFSYRSLANIFLSQSQHIALTIYGENVQYNLVNMSDNPQEEQLFIDLNNCRVFSQQKPVKKDKD